MKWYTEHRGTVRAAVLVVVILIAIGAGFATYSVTHTQQQNAATVNGINLPQGKVDSLATIAARVHQNGGKFTPNLVAIAQDEIEYQKAVQLGAGCSTAEAAAQLKSQDATTVAHLPDTLLTAIEDSGDATVGYHLTPEAERTPDTASVIAAYEADPAIIGVVQKLCSVARMEATIEAGATPGPDGRPHAVETFRAGLYAHSTVIAADGSPIDVRLATPTP